MSASLCSSTLALVFPSPIASCSPDLRYSSFYPSSLPTTVSAPFSVSPYPSFRLGSVSRLRFLGHAIPSAHLLGQAQALPWLPLSDILVGTHGPTR